MLPYRRYLPDVLHNKDRGKRNRSRLVLVRPGHRSRQVMCAESRERAAADGPAEPNPVARPSISPKAISARKTRSRAFSNNAAIVPGWCTLFRRWKVTPATGHGWTTAQARFSFGPALVNACIITSTFWAPHSGWSLSAPALTAARAGAAMPRTRYRRTRRKRSKVRTPRDTTRSRRRHSPPARTRPKTPTRCRW